MTLELALRTNCKGLITSDVVQKFRMKLKAVQSDLLEMCRAAGRQWAINAVPVEELNILRELIRNPERWARSIPDDYAASKLYQNLWPDGCGNTPEFWEALGVGR